MLQNYRGAPRGQIIRLQARATQLAIALGLNYSTQQIVNLVYRYGPRVVEHLRNQARNPGSTSSLERGFGPEPMDIATPAQMGPRRKFVGPVGPSKRMNFGNPAPAGIQQLTYHKRKYGRKKKVNIISRLAKSLKETEIDMICRWQSITSPQPTAQSMLSRYLSNYKDAAGVLFTSAYCFNYSALGRIPNQNWKNIPMYRLTKNTTVDKAVQSWDWIVEAGAKNNADGTTPAFEWQLEHYEGGFDPDGVNYRHDWSDVKIMFQGTTKYPVRFHVYRVRFLLDALAPRRHYLNAAGVDTTFDSAEPDSENFNEADYFWERFMEPKIVHPFAGTKKTGLMARKHLKIISHEVMNLGSEVTISSDVQPLQHIHSMFIRNGKYYKNQSAVQVEADLMPITVGPVTKVGIKGDGHVGYSNTNEVSTVTPYVVDRSQDEYVMIVAENYQQTGDFYEPVIEQDATNSPSFDIRVRSKYTVFQK